MDNSTVPLAAIALVGTILAVVVTPLFKLLNANTKATAALVEETRKGNEEANANTKATNALVEETRKGNEEAKERNGHLGDQSVHLANLVTAQNKDVSAIAAATALTAKTLSKSALIAAEDRETLLGGTQIVQEQHVEHQTINSKE